MSSEPSSLADLHYTCPVCFDPLFPPVFQCGNGHLMCEGCSSRLKTCGLCRATLAQVDWGRNLEVEKIIRMIQHPCPNETGGCQVKLKFDQLEAHRIECQYSKFPVCELLFGVRNCEHVRICDFEEHYEKKHGGESVGVTGPAATLPVSEDFELSIVDFDMAGFLTICNLDFEKKSIVFLVTGVVDAAHDFLKCKPWVLAGKAVANQLNCKISLFSGKDVKFTMMDSPIFNLETKKEELLACRGISWKYFQSCFTSPQAYETGKIRFQIDISKKTNEQASSAMDLSST